MNHLIEKRELITNAMSDEVSQTVLRAWSPLLYTCLGIALICVLVFLISRSWQSRVEADIAKPNRDVLWSRLETAQTISLYLAVVPFISALIVGLGIAVKLAFNRPGESLISKPAELTEIRDYAEYKGDQLIIQPLPKGYSYREKSYDANSTHHFFVVDRYDDYFIYGSVSYGPRASYEPRVVGRVPRDQMESLRTTS
jgi:hypothetical protein